MHKQINLVGTRKVPVVEGAPPVANQIDLFMHFLGASRDGLVARPVEMDKLSSSGSCMIYIYSPKCYRKQKYRQIPISIQCN